MDGRAINTETFIQRARVVHGNYYDYSKVVYTKACKKVVIICPIHGEFTQRASAHINNPAGCPSCMRKMSRKKIGVINRDIELLENGTRQCSHCRQFFEISEFYPSKRTKDGLSSLCKTCSDIFTREWEKNNQEHVKKREVNYNKRKWAKYKEEHKAEIENIKQEREAFLKERRILGEIARKIRVHIRQSVKNGDKTCKSSELMGCTIDFFRKHIESMWTEGMTWENNVYTGWHLDHIRPCASFDLSKTEEQKKCFNWTNYQPMWGKPNIRKGSLYKGVRYGRTH